MIHPLWHLIPATIGAGVTAYITYSAISDARAGLMDTNRWFLCGISGIIAIFGLGAFISAIPPVTFAIDWIAQ